jgi:hypothetical protein
MNIQVFPIILIHPMTQKLDFEIQQGIFSIYMSLLCGVVL